MIKLSHNRNKSAAKVLLIVEVNNRNKEKLAVEQETFANYNAYLYVTCANIEDYNLQGAIIQYPPRSNTAHKTGRLESIPSLPVLCAEPYVSVNYAFRRYAPKRK